MSSETDHPRQRTVAELLAQHGDTGATGRRRRRREADGDDDAPQAANGVAAGPAAWAAAPPPAPDRSVLRQPVPRDQPPREQTPWSPAPRDSFPREKLPPRQAAPRSFAPEPAPEPPARNGTAASSPSSPSAPSSPTMAAPAVPPVTGRRRKPEPEAAPVRENPTDHIPRYREDRTGVIDPGLTGPIDQQQLLGLSKPPVIEEPAAEQPDDDGGPATMVGVAPAGAESWHRVRTGRPAPDVDAGPPTQAASPLDFDDRPAGLDLDDDEPDDLDDLDDDRSARRKGSADASPGQAWAAVVAQWIVGAIGGAALWVGFRFLWRELPVVALAAAVLVTVGLVLVVRALLRNNDMRTTVFAVLVGLLLTVSPAILVLLGR